MTYACTAGSRTPVGFLQDGDVLRRSTEGLHEHQFATRLVELRVQNPAIVRGHRHAAIGTKIETLIKALAATN